LKRIAIFAHFDKQDIVDAYVISYLKELKKFCEIIFVSDSNLPDLQINKIKNYCFDFIAQKHEEYDFGSYKRGLNLIHKKYPKKLQQSDEIIFINDSCYLLGSFKKIFLEMSKKSEIDFWGLTDHCPNILKQKDYHIQSYFIAFRKNIFLNDLLLHFMKKVKKQENKWDIIKHYEIGLSKYLISHKKKPFCYFSSSVVDKFITDNKAKIAKRLNNKYPLAPQSIFDINNSNYLFSDKIYIMLTLGLPLIKISPIYNRNIDYYMSYYHATLVQEFSKYNINNIITNHLRRIDQRPKNPKEIASLQKKVGNIFIKSRKYSADSHIKAKLTFFFFFKIKIYSNHMSFFFLRTKLATYYSHL